MGNLAMKTTNSYQPAPEAIKEFKNIMALNRKGEQAGVYCVCSAQPLVIEACLEAMKGFTGIIDIEATCNQVDQNGGYTDMTPKDFADMVYNLAEKTGFPTERIVLAGDHLGPNAKTHLGEKEAMKYSKEMVRQYVEAGFRKIHIDPSMKLAGDEKEYGDGQSIPAEIFEKIVAKRTIELVQVAEETWRELGSPEPKPIYVIGTEVPTPGGEVSFEAITPTDPKAAINQVNMMRDMFREAELTDAWSRVVGFVVQPGVDFSDGNLMEYNPEQAKGLADALNANVEEELVFEAHSTDYSKRLKDLVNSGFGILKVGPELTYAMREALFALEKVESDLIRDPEKRSNLERVMHEEMNENPGYWKKYYTGTPEEIAEKKTNSYLDRIRYYWNTPGAQEALKKLHKNLSGNILTDEALRPHFDHKILDGFRDQGITLSAKGLVKARIAQVAHRYAEACGMSPTESM